MKKTLLSVIAGLAVINAASAVPSPEDRRKLCESKPYDFVWVEKTQTCVPINPCETQNNTIRDAYCIWADGVISYDSAEPAITRYVKNVMKTGVESIKPLNFDSMGSMIDFAVRTTDGGYYGVRFSEDHGKPENTKYRLMTACWAYGKEAYYHNGFNDEYGCVGVATEKECTDIADFASLLDGTLVEGKIEQLGQSICMLINGDGWRDRFENAPKEGPHDGVIYHP